MQNSLRLEELFEDWLNLTNNHDQNIGCQVSGVRGEGSDNEELYGCGGQRTELRGRKSEVKRQGVSCGSGFQPRSYDFNDSNEFNDLPLIGIAMLDEVSAFMFFS